MNWIRALLAPLVLLSASCGGDLFGGSRWNGTMADSAGIAIATNTESGTWRDAETPTVTRELDIGTAEGEAQYLFGLIAGIDVGSDGSIYVFDQQSLSVRVFDPAGAFLRQMGRPGSGPGELGRGSAGLLVSPGDTVFVPDLQQQRMVRYTKEGTDAGTFPIPLSEGVSMRWAMTSDGLLIQQTRMFATADQPGGPQNDFLFVRDGSGVLQDTLLALPAGQSVQLATNAMPKIRLFEAEPIWALTTDGKVLYGLNSEYNIKLYDRSGRLERIIRRPFTQNPVTDADEQAFRDFMREAIIGQGLPPQLAQQFLDNVQFADNYPAFANIIGGIDGSIWVQRIQTAREVAARGGQFSAQDVGGPSWDVYDAQGRYLGVLEVPARFTPLRVKGNQVYGSWRDDLDVQHVLRLRIEGNWIAGG